MRCIHTHRTRLEHESRNMHRRAAAAHAPRTIGLRDLALGAVVVTRVRIVRDVIVECWVCTARRTCRCERVAIDAFACISRCERTTRRAHHIRGNGASSEERNAWMTAVAITAAHRVRRRGSVRFHARAAHECPTAGGCRQRNGKRRARGCALTAGACVRPRSSPRARRARSRARSEQRNCIRIGAGQRQDFE